MPAIGHATWDENRAFEGQLRTLSIRTEIAIVANKGTPADTQPGYRVLSGDVEIGDGWNRRAKSSAATMCRSASRHPSSDRVGSTPISARRRGKRTASPS